MGEEKVGGSLWKLEGGLGQCLCGENSAESLGDAWDKPWRGLVKPLGTGRAERGGL